MKIVPLTIKDFESIYEIEIRAYEVPWPARSMQQVFEFYGSHYKLLNNTGSIIGYAFISVITDEAHILNITIDPKVQGKGYGRKFLELIINDLQKKKLVSLFLEVRKSNHVAQHLYESVGFNQIGTRKNYYPTRGHTREDALLMVCELQPFFACINQV